jgi:hypothetical protein
MAVIKVKNFLRLGTSKRQVVWDQLRDEALMQKKVTLADLPGVGKALSLVVKWSVSAHGIVVFLIGDDPGPELDETIPG